MMESERAQNFHDRLNQWVAGQGFWFQLRHSMSGGGKGGTGGFRFLQFLSRILIFLLVIALGGLVYLFKRTDSKAFRRGIERSLVAETGAKEGKMVGFLLSQGKLLIPRFAAVGEDGAFFTDLDAKNIGCKMGLFAGLAGPWDTGTITISRLDINLRAGTEDARSAEMLGRVLFKNRPKLDFSSIDVEDATISWGYSATTRGLIEHSRLKIRRVKEGWRLQFKEGRFSQNWLKGLEIQELVVICADDGIRFTTAMFKKGDGTVDLSDLKVNGAENPVVVGVAKLRHLPMEGILPAAEKTLLEGRFSGDFQISGSTNSSDGIGFEGEVRLGKGDEISLRDRMPLLRALRVADAFNNYRRVSFRDGSFRLTSGGAKLALSEISLSSDDLLTVEGKMNLRPSTQQELKLKMQEKPRQRLPYFSGDDDDREGESLAISDFDLPPDSKKTPKNENKASKVQVLDRYEERLKERAVVKKAADRAMASLLFEGELLVKLKPDAFERSEKLRAEFPKNEETGRIHLKVPIAGWLNDLTLEQALDIYHKGQR